MRYFMTFSYDGSEFSGYQKQPKVRTVQGELEKVLKQINNNKETEIHASGRTDAGTAGTIECRTKGSFSGLPWGEYEAHAPSGGRQRRSCASARAFAKV